MAGSRKRRMQQRVDRQPTAKRQKRSRHAASPPENPIDEPMKITGLNYDCHEKIFDRLDFDTFFNMALSNKSLQMAAATAFKHRFGNKKIILYPSKTNKTLELDDRIVIYGLKGCLQFVRCFGEIMTNLDELKSDLNRKSNDYLNHYVQQYCAATLKKICDAC